MRCRGVATSSARVRVIVVQASPVTSEPLIQMLFHDQPAPVCQKIWTPLSLALSAAAIQILKLI